MDRIPIDRLPESKDADVIGSDRVSLAMGYSEAVAKSRGILCLARPQRFFDKITIVGSIGDIEGIHHFLDDLLFRCTRTLQQNEFIAEERLGPIGPLRV